MGLFFFTGSKYCKQLVLLIDMVLLPQLSAEKVTGRRTRSMGR